MMEVVAAFVNDGSRFMICQRSARKARGTLWEFPGGKVEPGETGEQAICRECREELGVEITVRGEVACVLHEYPDLTIRLHLYDCRLGGTPVLKEHKDLKWVTPETAGSFAFCPADAELLDLIMKNGFGRCDG